MTALGHTAYIGIGSNLGDRLQYLRRAAGAFDVEAQIVRTAPIFETDPVELLEQPAFFNTVLEVRTDLRPLELLAALHEIEHGLGRERLIRFGPRTVDMDILLYDDEYVCFQSLQIPHPRMWQRAFVLVPLAHLVPDRRGPGGRTVADLAAEFHGRGVRHVGCLW